MATKQSKVTTEPTSMEELLARAGATIKSFSSGEKIQAKLLSMDSKMAAFDVGGKSEGLVVGPYFDEARDYLKTLKVGDTVEATVMEPEGPDGFVRLSLRHSAIDSVWDRLEEAHEKEREIQVVVKNASDKGLNVEFETASGFIPSSQLGRAIIADPQKTLGKHIAVRVLDVDRDRRKVVFSERAISEAGEIELHELAREALNEDDTYTATVKQVTGFGAFVEIMVTIGDQTIPVEGLVHVSELSWEKIDEPGKAVKIGDTLEVKLIGTKDGKLAFSAKQAQADPWMKVAEKYQKDAKVTGTVVRSSNFGVFVELEPGVEGLIHITKIAPGTDLKPGQTIDAYVEDVHAAERRISLGLILTSKPVGYK